MRQAPRRSPRRSRFTSISSAKIGSPTECPRHGVRRAAPEPVIDLTTEPDIDLTTEPVADVPVKSQPEVVLGTTAKATEERWRRLVEEAADRTDSPLATPPSRIKVERTPVPVVAPPAPSAEPTPTWDLAPQSPAGGDRQSNKAASPRRRKLPWQVIRQYANGEEPRTPTRQPAPRRTATGTARASTNPKRTSSATTDARCEEARDELLATAPAILRGDRVADVILVRTLDLQEPLRGAFVT